VPIHTLGVITQAGLLRAVFEKAFGCATKRATEAVRGALAPKIGANERGLDVGLWLV
jgi:hypothetical protein